MIKIVAGVVGFIAFVAALVIGARLLEPGPARNTRPSAPAGSPAVEPAAAPAEDPSQDPPLPALFVVKNDVDATPIALAGPRKKPLLLHLWASWCGPCIAELPSLLALGRQCAFDVIAVSVDDRWPDVVRFFAGKIPPEVVWDPKVTLEPTLGVRSLPTTFLVDTRGLVRARHTGAQDWLNVDMKATLQRTLAQSTPERR